MPLLLMELAPAAAKIPVTMVRWAPTLDTIILHCKGRTLPCSSLIMYCVRLQYWRVKGIGSWDSSGQGEPRILLPNG